MKTNFTTLLMTFLGIMSISTVACQADTSVQVTDEAIKQIQADPMLQEFIFQQEAIQNMIMQGRVDFEESRRVRENHPSLSFCEPSPELLEVRGWKKYAASMCAHLTLLQKLKDKYPVIDELDVQAKQELLYPHRYLTEPEILSAKGVRDSIKYNSPKN